ncbi:hypothetical protein GCM10020366_23310 [Saccharopolyspora gregorii]|uniref:Uncharacterized protein n=1 Tax=Saccharopolyspora gregorii TaxID=33914 RepID=A0ABP6RQT0_9PSEU
MGGFRAGGPRTPAGVAGAVLLPRVRGAGPAVRSRLLRTGFPLPRAGLLVRARRVLAGLLGPAGVGVTGLGLPRVGKPRLGLGLLRLAGLSLAGLGLAGLGLAGLGLAGLGVARLRLTRLGVARLGVTRLGLPRLRRPALLLRAALAGPALARSPGTAPGNRQTRVGPLTGTGRGTGVPLRRPTALMGRAVGAAHPVPPGKLKVPARRATPDAPHPRIQSQRAIAP